MSARLAGTAPARFSGCCTGCWLEAYTPSLCIQSPMGTGKTTLLKSIVAALVNMLGRPVRVLIFSYRQALSRDMQSNFEELDRL
jgi:hypothetical protein